MNGSDQPRRDTHRNEQQLGTHGTALISQVWRGSALPKVKGTSSEIRAKLSTLGSIRDHTNSTFLGARQHTGERYADRSSIV